MITPNSQWGPRWADPVSPRKDWIFSPYPMRLSPHSASGTFLSGAESASINTRAGNLLMRSAFAVCASFRCHTVPGPRPAVFESVPVSEGARLPCDLVTM